MAEPKQQTAAVAVQEKNISDNVLRRIKALENSGEIKIPKDYSPENALKAAWLTVQDVVDKNGKKALEVCTQESVAQALLKMVVWGLSPLKKQCDFIVRGSHLCCDPEYTGNIVLAKRYAGMKWIKANAIFQDDDFAYEVDSETGRRKLVHHKQTIDSLGTNKIKGAYAIFELADGTRDMEVMNISQIQTAWGQGAARGNSPAHQKFTDQMAIKTVINRATKLLIRGSDDNVLFDDNDETRDATGEAVQHTMYHKANQEEISIEDAEVVATETKTEVAKEKPETTEQPASDHQKMDF